MGRRSVCGEGGTSGGRLEAHESSQGEPDLNQTSVVLRALGLMAMAMALPMAVQGMVRQVRWKLDKQVILERDDEM